MWEGGTCSKTKTREPLSLSYASCRHAVFLVSVPLVTTFVSSAIPLSYVREIGCDRPAASIYPQVKKKKKKDFKWETIFFFLRKRWKVCIWYPERSQLLYRQENHGHRIVDVNYLRFYRCHAPKPLGTCDLVCNQNLLGFPFFLMDMVGWDCKKMDQV